MMVEFWSNHFNVNLFDGPIQVFKAVDDRDNIRPHALGRFKDLLHANAKSPAMLYFLDGFSNWSHPGFHDILPGLKKEELINVKFNAIDLFMGFSL